ncbi:MAG: penicillin acylase family protein [Nitrospira sp.]
MQWRPFMRRALWSVLTTAVVFAVTLWVTLRLSLPDLTGEQELRGLEQPVAVAYDEHGIPTIKATSRRDAYRALGYVTARDRLFQMDLFRRSASGRLAEIFGQDAVELDTEQRIFGFQQVAAAVSARLSEHERQTLQAYADGVNAFLIQAQVLPFEFVVLQYRPDPWTIEDSCLVMLYLYQKLSWSDLAERTMTVMEQTLPADVVAFLTPDSDPYTVALFGGTASHRPMQQLPRAGLASLLRSSPRESPSSSALLQVAPRAAGSNAWAVDRTKTTDGRAILANDMHHPLSLPSLWYRTAITDGATTISGVIAPGMPVVIAGSNDQVAWGVTNALVDTVDLVLLEIDSQDVSRYRAPDGWRQFEERVEVIRVKDEPAVSITVRNTIWGPVSRTPLLRKPVAVRWILLDASALNFKMLHMAEADTIERGLTVMNQAGGAPLNVVLADRSGRIAWTWSGKVPVRHGFDGTTSRSWADGRIGWRSYVAPEWLPRVVDPPSGFIAVANSRTVGADYPYMVGSDFDNGYRAYHIAEHLREMMRVTEDDMRRLQLDTHSHLYQFYQRMRLDVLTEDSTASVPLLAEARRAIAAWDGRAEVDSVGFTLLVSYRNLLVDRLIGAILEPCRRADPTFQYEWGTVEGPLRTLLAAKEPVSLLDHAKYKNWDDFLRTTLLDLIGKLKQDLGVQSLEELTWGRLNTPMIAHPLAEAIPLIGQWLELSDRPLPGCDLCIRASSSMHGASERLVVSPGRHGDAMLHIPGGQSGHPLSAHFTDQYPYWMNGDALPFMPGRAVDVLTLKPVESLN